MCRLIKNSIVQTTDFHTSSRPARQLVIVPCVFEQSGRQRIDSFSSAFPGICWNRFSLQKHTVLRRTQPRASQSGRRGFIHTSDFENKRRRNRVQTRDYFCFNREKNRETLLVSRTPSVFNGITAKEPTRQADQIKVK